jgi:flagella basal body P-ring formation protein FlgA
MACVLLMFVVAPATPAPAAEASPSGVVVLLLSPQAGVAQREVFIGDVVRMEGGAAELRRRIAKLDLAEFDLLRPEVTIRKEQIAFRLMLAGIPESSFRLSGAASVRVTRTRFEIGDQDVIQAASDYVGQQAPWPAEDVVIRPAEGAALTEPLTLRGGDRVRLIAELPANSVLLGRVNVSVAIEINGAAIATVTVPLDVKVQQNVVTAAQRIERGEQLNQTNTRLTRRLVDAPHLISPGDGLLGKRCKRALQAGQLITAADVEGSADDTPVLIQPRQQVQLIAKRGGFRISAVGEALQEGRAGQMIRVRNVRSKVELQGRVIDASTVEVDF